MKYNVSVKTAVAGVKCECTMCGRRINRGEKFSIQSIGKLAIFNVCNDCKSGTTHKEDVDYRVAV